MRLKFKQVKFQNFLSAGNQLITIDLDKSLTTLIYGDNGSGKSTVYEALYFGLYGKAFRDANKPDLVNNINLKGTVVTVNFTVNDDKFSVVRGIKPNIFEIRRNDKLLDEGSSVNDYQKMLEQTILRMSSATFLQVVVLGSSDFIPFMKLSAPNRRKIVEELFDITIFSSMNTLTKKRNVDKGKEKLKLDQQKELIESAIIIMTNHFDNVVKKQAELVKRGEAAIRKKQKEIDDIELKKDVRVEVMKNLESQTCDITETKAENVRHGIETDNLNREKRINEKEIKFFEHTEVCPTCNQGLGADSRDKNIRKLLSSNEEIDKKVWGLATLIEENSVIIDRINKIDIKIRTEDLVISQFNSEISILENTIENYRAKILEIQSTDTQKEAEALTEKKMELIRVVGKLRVVEDQVAEYKTILELLTDNGIKKYIINKYLPILNGLVKKYMDILEFSVKFSFDEQFKDTIVTTGRKNLSYGSFSEGERSRIDLAILFAFREFVEIRSRSSCSLIIFDEIADSTLDQDGWDAFQHIINTVNNSNIFVISHKGYDIADEFNDSIKFKKRGNFSCIDPN